MEANSIRIDSQDNVAVAFGGLSKGEPVAGVPGVAVTANEDIARNHKVAIREIPAGAAVVKYGESIGLATCPIRPGDWVHTHNLRSGWEL